MSGGMGLSFPWYLKYPMYFTDGCYKLLVKGNWVKADPIDVEAWQRLSGKKTPRQSKEHPMTDYPAWVCQSCGVIYGRRIPKEATWHTNECDVCGNQTAVTEPRDFGHLKPEWKQHRKATP